MISVNVSGAFRSALNGYSAIVIPALSETVASVTACRSLSAHPVWTAMDRKIPKKRVRMLHPGRMKEGNRIILRFCRPPVVPGESRDDG